MRKKRTDAGFSLIETVIVILGILVLSAIAIPSIASFLRVYHIRGAAQEVRATMQTARLKAVANNVQTGVLFVVVDSKHYQWAIEDRLEGAGPGQEQGRNIDPADLVGADWPGQVGPLQLLPGRVEFSATACGGDFVPNNYGLRFGNLGTMCAPGSDTKKCRALDAGAKLVETDDTGGAVCLSEVVRKQQYLVHVTTSGVIKADFVEPTPQP
jgi:type II secretory pathway pseudopilin PulG